MSVKSFFKKIGLSKEELRKKNIPTLKNIQDGAVVEETIPIQPSGIPEQQDPQKVMNEPLTYEKIVEILIDKAKKEGRTFDNNEKARQWAIKKMDKMAEKMRKQGAPICCKVCGKSQVKGIGPLVRVGNDYAHKCCINQEREKVSDMIKEEKKDAKK